MTKMTTIDEIIGINTRNIHIAKIFRNKSSDHYRRHYNNMTFRKDVNDHDRNVDSTTNDHKTDRPSSPIDAADDKSETISRSSNRDDRETTTVPSIGYSLLPLR